MRSDIINEAREWIGVPFRHQGRNRRGVDCAGLLYVVFKPDIDFFQYSENPSTVFVFRNIRLYAKRIKENEAGPGDVVIMRFEKMATHLGIITDKGVIHADAFTKRVIEQGMLKSRVVAYFRMKGVKPWRG